MQKNTNNSNVNNGSLASLVDVRASKGNLHQDFKLVMHCCHQHDLKLFSFHQLSTTKESWFFFIILNNENLGCIINHKPHDANESTV